MLDGQNNDSERPGIEETYSSATNTSNLTVEGRRRMPADTVIAAGWSRSRLGAALLRLHSEWDGAEKTAKLTEEKVRELAASLQVDPTTFDADPEVGPLPVPPRPNPNAGLVREFDGKRNRYRQPMVVARESAARWHRHELGILFGKLKTLPEVREQLTKQAVKWGIGVSCDPITRTEISESRENDRAMLQRMRVNVEAKIGVDKAAAEGILAHYTEEVAARRAAEAQQEWHRASAKVAAVLGWWLNPCCPVCDGQRWQVIAGTGGRCSDRVCADCNGRGEADLPHGEDGRKMLVYLNDCLSAARESMQGRFRHQKGKE